MDRDNAEATRRETDGDNAEAPEREYDILLNSIHDGIWVIDASGITLHVNKAMERIAGIRAADVVGRHVGAAAREGLFSTCVTLCALAEKRVVTMFDDYANGKRCLNTSTPVFDSRGEICRVIASIRDLTELESLQRTLAGPDTDAMPGPGPEPAPDGGFVGHSDAMRKLRRDVAKAAGSDAVTLILGETGTGKTHAARVIHSLGARRDRPFVAVNCGAIPPQLMESELFGYERGAFTGAAPGGKPGFFELAHTGTLLLDEIGDLPPPMQVKLLQVLDGHPFRRVGGTRPVSADVRVIAASNRPLAAMTADGLFREDLFYRLRVLSLEIPPLREHPDDIPPLAMFFLREAARESGVRKSLEPRLLSHMRTYAWPGNVRELAAVVQSLVAMSEGEGIGVEDLPPYMREGGGEPVPPSRDFRPHAAHGSPELPSRDVPRARDSARDAPSLGEPPLRREPSAPRDAPSPRGTPSLREAVEELEKKLISAALAETGSTYKAARRLKLSQSTLFRKARRYGIGLSGRRMR